MYQLADPIFWTKVASLEEAILYCKMLEIDGIKDWELLNLSNFYNYQYRFGYYKSNFWITEDTLHANRIATVVPMRKILYKY